MSIPPPSIVEVIRDEFELIRKRRKHRSRSRAGEARAASVADKIPRSTNPEVDIVGPDADAEMMKLRVEMLNYHVTGLAISGGGIRSGTFAVGFLQGLANLRLLRRFDYLSTVSGGGYAGGWLAAWLKREGDVENVERQLDFSRIRQAESERQYFDSTRQPKPVVDEEPEPLRHLRSYSSFLFPRPGPLSVDTWTVIAIWGRNVTINFLLLFPLAMIVVLLLRLVLFFFQDLNADAVADESRGWVLATVFVVAGAIMAQVALMMNAQSVQEFRARGAAKQARNSLGRSWAILLLSVAAAFSLTVCSRWLLWHLGEYLEAIPGRPSGGTLWGVFWGLIVDNLDLLQAPSFVFVMVIFATFMVAGSMYIMARTGAFSGRFLGAAALAGLTSGFLFVLLLGIIRAFARANRPDLMATFAVPGALVVVLASLIVEVAVAGRAMTEGEREWWGHYGAGLAISCLAWMIAMGSTLYLPALFLYGGAWLRVAIASGWVGTTALGIVTGRFVLPKLQAGGGGQGLAKLASLAPPVFLIGLLGLLGLFASFLLNTPGLSAPRGDDLTPFAYYLEGLRGADFRLIVVLGLGFAFLAGLALRLIDVNLFSLNAMYMNRLVRCYLGASRPMPRWNDRWGGRHDRTWNAGAPSISDRVPIPSVRDANPVTGFDPGDDLPLSELRIGETEPGARDYWGPHLLINTTINLVAGKDLAWRDRKGDSFTLSPLYCGAKSVGYARLGDDEASRTNLTLGRAMAISGAAIDPNMKYYQSPALTALLLLFNARLGYWMQNPLKGNWKAGTPEAGFQLLQELFGKTDGSGDYVHLSDGGHFENMGVYELIRRRCRYIVALDAGDEPTASDANLANLIRLCRIDFGIRIQIDTAPTRPTGPDRLSRSHVVVGRIRYDDADQGQLPGVLVYVRASMTGDEPPDLQNYAARDTNFPFQPTDLRQAFDEEQFECYRCLGDHVASEVFSTAMMRISRFEEDGHADYVPRLFSSLQARWGEIPETRDRDFVESTQAWIALQRDLRADPNLARLSRQLYPELPPAPAAPAPAAPSPDYDRAEFHVVSQMLQIMENTWLTLGLRGSSDQPLNRGWVNVFRRWVNTSAFQKTWPILRSEYGADFVRFCQDEMHLRARESRVVSFNESLKLPNSFTQTAIGLLSEEFRREWPDPPIPPASPVPSLPQILASAKKLGSGKSGPPIWFIVQDVEESNGKPPGLFVAGLVLAAITEDFDADFEGFKPDSRAGDSETREFFAWMRCGYRSSSLGSPCVREILDIHLPKALGVGKDKLPTLLTRYPTTARSGGDSELDIWLSFFARFDFRRVDPPRGIVWNQTRLKRPGKGGKP